MKDERLQEARIRLVEVGQKNLSADPRLYPQPVGENGEVNEFDVGIAGSRNANVLARNTESVVSALVEIGFVADENAKPASPWPGPEYENRQWRRFRDAEPDSSAT